MDIGQFRRRDHLLVAAVRIEPRDVLRDRPLEELDVLRKIAHETRDLVIAPLRELRPVETHRPLERRHHANDGTRQR